MINTKRDTSAPVEAEEINSRGYLGFKELKEIAVTNDNIKSFTDNIQQYIHQNNTDYNPAYYEKIMGLIDKSKLQGITLVFILPPVRLTEGMMAVFNAIPDENKIEVCDPEKYPELYNSDNWIDPIHLNTIGSTYLTQYVCKQFSRINNN